MYWNINEILPYQRHFNFINGPREIGKTYTTLKWLIKQALTKNKTFAYICRTQDEKKNGIGKYAVKKVVDEQYSMYDLKGDNFELKLNDTTFMYVIALSEYMKIKKLSFPTTYYTFFDEYMLEAKDSGAYVHGWKEPDLFLNIYQTIDRGRDSTISFFMGNNTTAFNPYHIHEAFRIPQVEPGQIWTSQNTLFQYALPSEELKKKLESNAFNKQVKGTRYGNYAIDGQYVNDTVTLISGLSKDCVYQFSILYESDSYGVYTSPTRGIAIVSEKYNPCFPTSYAMTLSDHSENTLLLSRDCTHLKWLDFLYKRGLLRFESMEVKAKSADWLKMVIR